MINTITTTPTHHPKRLCEEAAMLCQFLTDRMESIADNLKFAEEHYDLDTYTACQFQIERLERIWKKADKRFYRRLNKFLLALTLAA
jgi:hypothetical protein